jgi:hypothetical protein
VPLVGALKAPEERTMLRVTLWTLLGLLVLCAEPVQTSPVVGPFREQNEGESRRRLEPKDRIRFPCKFVGNERACVIVEGDHDPVMKLVLKVFDSSDKLVAEDAGGDILAVAWYPPRTQEYFIEITQDPTDKTQFKGGYNALIIVVK